MKYIFSSNDEKKTCENNCRNLFAPVQKHLRGNNDALVILVESCKAPPTFDDAKFVFETLRSGVKPNQLHKARFGLFGYYDTPPPAMELGDGLSTDGVAFIVSKGDFISGGSHCDLLI